MVSRVDLALPITFCVFTQCDLLTNNFNKMDELITKLQEKANACGDKTKEDRARKGAYIDCIVELKALRKHAVSNWAVLKR